MKRTFKYYLKINKTQKQKLDRDVNAARNVLNLAETGSTRTFLERGEYLSK